MAITIINLPNQLEPVYSNSVPFVISSPLSQQNNFRYVFDVYKNDLTTSAPTFLSRVTPFPRPDTTGLYSPHYILRDIISYDANPYIATVSYATHSYIKYSIQFGEQYNPGITWSSTQNNGGFLQLNFTQSHNLLTNDVIRLDKIDESINLSYNGSASITSVPSVTSIVVDKTYGIPVSNENGVITSLLRLATISSVLNAFNSTRQYEERTRNFGMSYSFDGGYQKPFLTDIREKNFIALEYDTLSYFKSLTTSMWEPTSVEYTLYDSNNTILGTYSQALSFSPYRRADIPTGLRNLGQTMPFITFLSFFLNKSYTVQVYSGLTAVSIPFRYINNTVFYSNAGCREYDIIQIMYLNKLGAFEYFTFNLISRVNRKTSRQKYKKVLSYNYSIGDRGQTIFDEQITEEMILNSDWLSDDDAIRMRDLIESPEVYMISVTPNELYTTETIQSMKIPLIVTNDTYEVKNTLNDGLFQFTLSVEKAYPIWINI